MENELDFLDKEKMYISPSNEGIIAFVDGKWQMFMREDKVKELLKGEYYTFDQVNPKNKNAKIAGEDALMLNPVYDLNKYKAK